MERAEYDSVVDLPVGNWPTLVRANCRQSTKGAVPLAEHGNLMTSDRKGSTFAVRDRLDRAAGVCDTSGKSCSNHQAPPSSCSARSGGIVGSTSSGSEVWNWPGVTGSAPC